MNADDEYVNVLKQVFIMKLFFADDLKVCFSKRYDEV